MKELMNRLPKRVYATVLAAAVLIGLSTSALAGFGPNRPTKAWTSGVAGFDHVTFNSFTGVGNGIGDERDFIRGVQVGRDSVWSDPVQNVTQDAEVEAKIYIHNGADGSLNDAPGNPGIARNVNVRVALPTGEKQSQDITSYIKASNAQPGEVFDTLTLTGANQGNFALDYVAGSAKLHDNGSVTNLTAAQEQALISNAGMNLADIPGCFDYVREVTFRVKVKMPQYGITKQVRFKGQTAADWKDSVDAKAGDSLEWSIKFRNIGKTTLNQVMIVDEIPVGLDAVAGSVKLVTSDFPTGTTDLSPNPIQANGRQININAGNYRPLNAQEIAKGQVSAQVIFETKVAPSAAQKCGNFTLVNKAYAQPQGVGSINDSASVNVKGETCTTTTTTPPTPTSLPKTGAGSVAGIVAAVSVAGALAHRFVGRRKYSA